MSIKRIFIAMTAIFAASAVFADDSGVTSKKYVDDLMSGYQGKLPGSGANKLMIYDDEAGIGEKSIEATLGENATSVPTVGAVKTGLDGKQDTINGVAGYVMTGTGTPGEVGEKPIYSANTNYTDSLVTAETVNSGVINAVNSSLIQVNATGDQDPNGTLWQIADSFVALDVQPLLPEGYTRLLYLESTGKQYIDTGQILNTATDDVELVFQANEVLSGNSLFGARTRTTSRTYTFSITSTLYYGIGWLNSTTTTNVAADTNKHTLKIEHNGGVFKLDGNVINERGDGSITTPTTATLFAIHATSGSGLYYGYTQIYEYKLWRNGTMIQHFVPARNSSGVQGMYDLMDSDPSTAFHAKAGTGTFIEGPPVGN